MKKLYTVIAAFAVASLHFDTPAQVRIGGIVSPHQSAILDLNASNNIDNGSLGLSLPRVELTATDQAAPVTNPIKGLMVYNTASNGSGAKAVSPGIYYWDSAAGEWQMVGGNGWLLYGNSSASAANFIGTTSVVGADVPLTFKLHGDRAGLICGQTPFNTAFGYKAAAVAGTGNTALGFQAIAAATGNYNIGIGCNASPHTAGGSYQLTIGSYIDGYSKNNSNGQYHLNIDATVTNKASINNSDGNIDFEQKSNLASTSSTSIALSGLKDGGTYTVACTTTALTIPLSGITTNMASTVFPTGYTTITKTSASQKVVFTVICIGDTAYVYPTLFD
jgi:hypothetical protein